MIFQTTKYKCNYRMIADKTLNVNNYKMATTSKKRKQCSNFIKSNTPVLYLLFFLFNVYFVFSFVYSTCTFLVTISVSSDERQFYLLFYLDMNLLLHTSDKVGDKMFLENGGWRFPFSC